MFTGIVEEIGEVISCEPEGDIHRLVVRAKENHDRPVGAASRPRHDGRARSSPARDDLVPARQTVSCSRADGALREPLIR